MLCYLVSAYGQILLKMNEQPNFDMDLNFDLLTQAKLSDALLSDEVLSSIDLDALLSVEDTENVVMDNQNNKRKSGHDNVNALSEIQLQENIEQQKPKKTLLANDAEISC